MVAFKTLAKTPTVYGLLVILFFVGLFIVRLPIIKEMLDLNYSYSIVSGLSLGSWFLSLALLLKWLKSKESDRIIRKKLLIGSTLILVSCSIILYPPIISLFFPWKSLLQYRTFIVLFCAALTAFASFQVYLLGLNSNYRGEKIEKDGIIKFLLTSTTLVSLASIALTFVLSGSDYLVATSSSYQRAVAASAYCLVPIAAYCLGYLAKILEFAVAEGVGLLLSLILSFIIGATVLSVMLWNGFFFSAVIPLSLVIGFLLAFFEKNNGLSSLSK
jgi:hypothetical protein